MCPAHLFDGPLCCLRTDEHSTGHIFGASEPGDTHYEPSESEH